MVRKTVLCILFFVISLTPSFSQITARTTGHIKGIVTAPNGEPIPGLTVLAGSPDMIGSRTTVTDRWGKYRFAFLPPTDNMEIKIYATFHKHINKSVPIKKNHTETVDIQLEYTPTESGLIYIGPCEVPEDSKEIKKMRRGQLRGRITNQNNDPLGNIRIEAWSPKFQKLFFTETNERGDYHFKDLLPGLIEIKIDANFHTPLSQKIQVTAKKRHRQNFKLRYHYSDSDSK